MADAVLLVKVVYDVTLAATAAIAWRWGGWSERVGVTIAAVATGISVLVHPVGFPLGLSSRYGFFAVDLLTLIAFDTLMVRSRAFWPLWATGLQLLTVAIDAAVIVAPFPIAPFRMIEGKLAYPILFGIIWGSLRSRRRRMRQAQYLHGHDPAGSN